MRHEHPGGIICAGRGCACDRHYGDDGCQRAHGLQRAPAHRPERDLLDPAAILAGGHRPHARASAGLPPCRRVPADRAQRRYRDRDRRRSGASAEYWINHDRAHAHRGDRRNPGGAADGRRLLSRLALGIARARRLSVVSRRAADERRVCALAHLVRYARQGVHVASRADRRLHHERSADGRDMGDAARAVRFDRRVVGQPWRLERRRLRLVRRGSQNRRARDHANRPLRRRDRRHRSRPQRCLRVGALCDARPPGRSGNAPAPIRSLGRVAIAHLAARPTCGGNRA